MDSSASSLEGPVFPELIDLGRHLSPGVVCCVVSPACVRLLVGGWILLSIWPQGAVGSGEGSFSTPEVFCGVLCSRFSLSAPQRWPVSGIGMVLCLPPWFSDSIGSQVPFATGSPLGSCQCRLAFSSASSPGFLRSSHVYPSVLRGGCQSLLAGILFLLFFPFVWKSLVFGGAFWLVQISGLPSRCGRPLGRVSVSLSPLTQSDLRISLATGSPFGRSSGLVAIRSPFFFLRLFPLCLSAVALALSLLWICFLAQLHGLFWLRFACISLLLYFQLPSKGRSITTLGTRWHDFLYYFLDIL